MSTSPAHWSRLKSVFFAAQDLDPDSRLAFVRRACADDPALEAEVLRLIELDAHAGSFLQDPAVAGMSWTDPVEPLCREGDLLASRFRVIALIGRGGMGEVYEAHDDILDHIVALKVVRPSHEPVASLAARWRQELLLSRKVTHSSVCRVHDLAIHRSPEGQELLLLTMERLHGEPLSRRLSALDQFPQVPATGTARQYLLGHLYAKDGNKAKSLRAFEQWTAGARRSEDRMPVVRAMLENGDLSGAERLLRNIVERPVAIYARPEPQAPGLWRQALVELERLLARRDPAAAARLRSEHTFIWTETKDSLATQAGSQ